MKMVYQHGDSIRYLADGLGSTMKTVDATGTVVNGYTYGKRTSSTGSQANEFDFTGQQTDPTGLQYLRARYYDPETGTFLSRDPMSTLPTWRGGGFGYVSANPANATDPSGLCPGWAPIGTCAAAKLFDTKDAVSQALGHVNDLRQTISDALGSAAGHARTVLEGLLGFANHFGDQLQLVGEYLGNRAVACLRNPADCYFALEHVALGVAIVSLAVGATLAACAASAGAFCLFAAIALTPVLITGLWVLGIGIEELHNLGEHPEENNLGQYVYGSIRSYQLRSFRGRALPPRNALLPRPI